MRKYRTKENVNLKRIVYMSVSFLKFHKIYCEQKPAKTGQDNNNGE